MLWKTLTAIKKKPNQQPLVKLESRFFNITETFLTEIKYLKQNILSKPLNRSVNIKNFNKTLAIN